MGCASSIAPAPPPPQQPLSLYVDGLTPGAPATVSVTGALAGERVDIYSGRGGFGQGPCPPQWSGLCVDMLAGPSGYHHVLRGHADASGTIEWTTPYLSGVALGAVQFQAVSASLNTSNAVERTLWSESMLPCPDGAEEPNDLQASATVVGDNSSGTYRQCDGNADWFTWPVQPGDTTRVDLYADRNNDGDVRMELIGGDGLRVNSTMNGTLSGALWWTNTYSTVQWPTVRTWMLRDTAESGADYVLEVESRPRASQCVVDAQEPDGNPNRAQELGVLSGTVCAGDEDWMRVHADVGEGVRFHIEEHGGALVTRYYDEVGHLLRSASYSGNGPHTYSVAVPAGGFTYLQLGSAQEGIFEAGATYTVSVEHVVLDVCAPDAREPDDTMGDATRITAGSLQGRACPTDSDWYQVDVRAGEVLRVVDDVRMQLSLYDPAGDLVVTSPTWYHGERELWALADTDGRWSIEVSMPQPDLFGEGQDYTLTTRIDPCVQEDRFEPNDTVQAATEYRVNEMRAGTLCPGNEDWFRVHLDAGQQVNLLVDQYGAEGQLTMQSPDGAVVFNQTRNRPRGTVIAPRTGWHSLRLRVPDTPDPAAYALWITTR